MYQIYFINDVEF